MKKFFTILVLVLIFVLLFGGLSFSAENRFRAESSGIAGLALLTDLETGCKYLVSSGNQSYVQPVLLPDGKPDCRRK
jgi:hypothetical protein